MTRRVRLMMYLKWTLRTISVLALLLLPALAQCQTAYYTELAIQPVNVLGVPTPVQGPIPYAAVRVCSLPLTQTSPCLPLATITDQFGNALSNSIGSNFGQGFADVTGRITIGCTSGTSYQLQYSGASNTPQGNHPISCGGNSPLIGGNLTIPGNLTVGNVSMSSTSPAIIWVDQNHIAGIAAALTACPSTGCTIVVTCPNGPYSETWTNLNVSKNFVKVIFACPTGNITMGTNGLATDGITVPAGFRSVAFSSALPFGNALSTGQNTGVTLNYIGTGNAVNVGANTSDSSGWQWEGLNLDLTGAGTSAVGMRVTRTQFGSISHNNMVGIGGASQSQQGIIIDGTGNYAGNLDIINNRVVQFKFGLQGAGTGAQAMNDVQIIGGIYGNCGAAGGIGVDIEGNEDVAYGADSENCTTGWVIGQNAGITTHGNHLVVHAENTTTNNINVAAQAVDTFVDNVNSLGTNLDNGTRTIFWNFSPGVHHLNGATGNSGGTWSLSSPTISGTIFGGANASFSNLGTITEFTYGETTAPGASAANDVCYGDSTAHAVKCSYNNGSFLQMPQVIASGTSTMVSGAVGGATCVTAVTSTATGAATTDAIEWAYATAPTLTTDALLHISPYVTSGNVNFTRCNPTAASITGTAIVINWRVIR